MGFLKGKEKGVFVFFWAFIWVWVCFWGDGVVWCGRCTCSFFFFFWGVLKVRAGWRGVERSGVEWNGLERG